MKQLEQTASDLSNTTAFRLRNRGISDTSTWNQVRILQDWLKPLTTSVLACASPFSSFHWFKSRLWKELASLWEFTLVYCLIPLGLLASPASGGEQSPVEGCYGSLKDNEGNSGKAIKGTGRNGGQEQSSEGKASLLHHADTRAGQQKMTQSAHTQTFKFPRRRCFLYGPNAVVIGKWLSGSSLLGRLLNICC